MINPTEFTHSLLELGIDKFVGVPDSFLKELTIEFESLNHLVVPNEGSAIAHAIGHYLGTQKPALVYMQNSGLGNALNPIISSAHKDVYGIPMLIFIGWRGEEGIHDEPQHMAQGETLLPILASAKIPYDILSSKLDKAQNQIKLALEHMQKNPAPFAFIIKKDLFAKSKKSPSQNSSKINRIDIIRNLHELNPGAIFLATTGYTARELYQVREELKLSHAQCFYHTGGMGHISQIAMGLALSQKDKNIILLEGDGSMAMHLGNYLSIASHIPPNLKIICFNNLAHLSVGGQKTSWEEIDITKVISSMGISTSSALKHNRGVAKKLEDLMTPNNHFLEIFTSSNTIENLPRPKETHAKLLKDFLDNLHAD